MEGWFAGATAARGFEVPDCSTWHPGGLQALAAALDGPCPQGQCGGSQKPS